MYVDHDLHTVFPAPLNSLVPDVEAVHKCVLTFAVNSALYGEFGVLVRIDHHVDFADAAALIGALVLPLKDYLCGHRHTEKIEAVVCDLVEHTVHILRPYAVKYLTSCIVAEPVYACEPYLIAVLVNDLCFIVYMEPVIAACISSQRCVAVLFGQRLRSRHKHYCRRRNSSKQLFEK